MRTRTTNSHVLTVGHRVESPDTTLSGEPHLTQIEKSTLPVTAVRSVAKGSTSRRASAPTRRGTPGSTATRSYTVQPPSLRVLLLWSRDCRFTPRLPRRGAVRGERHRPPLFPDTITASPTGRSPTASSNCMASNSQVHLRGTRPSALRAPVAVNTNRSADGFSTLTLFTSTRRESNATANRRGCGRSPRTSTRCTRSERVAEAMFRQKSSARTSRERSSAMAGRHIRHSPATSSGAGHIFSAKRKMSLTSTRTESQFTGISRKCTSVSSRGWRPTRAFVSEHRCTDQARTDSNRSLGAQLPTTQWQHCSGRRSRIDHWLTFIGEPAVSPTNNAAENALREPVVLRKIIGTLRNDRGMFVHETLLSLLATSRQQGRNPYEKLKRIVRDNEMISRTHAVPSVESSG